MRRAALAGLLCTITLAAIPAAAQDRDDGTAVLGFGGDRYAAGEDLRLDQETAGDLFAAGEELDLTAATGGAVHMAGRIVEIAAAPGGAVYAAGYEVAVSAALTGAATLFGAEVRVEEGVGGNLRLFAQDAEITGPISGSALIAARELTLDAPVAGDLMLAADEIDWGDAATVAGRLILYVEEGARTEVPDRVAPPDRVERREMEEFRGDIGPSVADLRRGAVRTALFGFVMSVLFVAALATAAVAMAPDHVAHWRETALARPGRSVVAGFLLLSTIVGSGFVLALTIIGIPLLPAFLFGAGLAGYAGYVLGSYILGVGLWQRMGNDIPEGVVRKAGLAALGAFVAGLVGLIPFLGWLVVLALAFAGLGAIVLHTREGQAA
ncbi:hypothetical protein HKCCSP123_08425 [Rhodobacterales bacterium HKCCSP123]|nr:hypothetical protein [Rhodobacterales bacterium HKCCSP123]